MKISQPTMSEMHSKQPFPTLRLGKLRVKVHAILLLGDIFIAHMVVFFWAQIENLIAKRTQNSTNPSEIIWLFLSMNVLRLHTHVLLLLEPKRISYSYSG
jgi:hypothetical protein